MKVIAIGDTHDAPDVDKQRFRWFGKYIRKVKPDAVVQIGDFITLDSCTHYIPDDTYSARIEKPTFIKEMDSFDDACYEFNYGLGNYQVKKYITLGNHERRLWRYEDKNPSFYNMGQREYFGICKKYEWNVIPWGKYLMLGGVGFIHAPINPMGKEYGGETSEKNVANKSKIDITRILNLGCALPHNHIEKYARHSLTGWTYQICEIDIWDNHIQEVKNISMESLQNEFATNKKKRK